MAASPVALRLGVNIDHVATVRNARGGMHPDPVQAALLAEKAGAQGITAHLREDRRHIRDDDIARLREALRIPLNFEMAATEEMVAIALKYKPHAACIVPEKREEKTTEGGLDVAGGGPALKDAIARLTSTGVRVSLFINPSLAQVDAARDYGAQAVEFHTGRYCEETGLPQHEELDRIQRAAKHAASLRLECHAGHGLSFSTVGPIAAIAELVELNIGHFLIGEAIFTGLEGAIHHMRRCMDEARGIKAGI